MTPDFSRFFGKFLSGFFRGDSSFIHCDVPYYTTIISHNRRGRPELALVKVALKFHLPNFLLDKLFDRSGCDPVKFLS